MGDRLRTHQKLLQPRQDGLLLLRRRLIFKVTEGSSEALYSSGGHRLPPGLLFFWEVGQFLGNSIY